MATNPIITEDQWGGTSGGAIVESGAPEATGFEAQHLFRNGRNYVWRTDNVTGAKTVVFSVPSARTVSFIELHRHNGTAAGTARFRLATTEANLTADPLHNNQISLHQTTDMATLSRRSCADIIATPVTGALWGSVEINDSANPDGYFTAARLIIGNALTLPLPRVESKLGFYRDDSLVNTGPLGHESGVQQDRILDFSARFNLRTVADVERLGQLYYDAGRLGDVGFIGNPDATTRLNLSLGVFHLPNEHSGSWLARLDTGEAYYRVGIDLRGI